MTMSFFLSLCLSFLLLSCVSQTLTHCDHDDINCDESKNFVPKNEHDLHAALKHQDLQIETPKSRSHEFEGSAQSLIEEHGLPEIGTRLAYYVMSGDSLSKIAKKIYKNMSKWKNLAKLNSIANPHRIYAGDVIYYELSFESIEFAKSYENSAFDYLIVKKGDSLSNISKRLFGTGDNWRVLWKENPTIKNPDRLFISQKVSFKEYDTLRYLKKSFHNQVNAHKKTRPSKKVSYRVKGHNHAFVSHKTLALLP